MAKKKIYTWRYIIIQALIGVLFIFLSYKYIDTAWIKWSLIVMIGGAFYYATIDDLIEFGKTYDFEVIEITAQQLENVSISSTKIRNALNEGAVQTANNYLGYPFMISGLIVKGKGIGKTLEFPTANLHLKEDYKLIPKNGVYLVQSIISGKEVFGLTNIGTNPTVGGTYKTIETYFLDYSNDLYQKEIQLNFIKRIREEKTFESKDALKNAIKKDELFARNYLKIND